VQFSERLVALNVRVALAEALSNAILRGNRERDDAFVRVRAQVDATMIVLEVADEGVGFDLDACTVDPTAPERLDAEDGRGLFLMRRLMHRVERFDVQGRSVIRMTLFRE
jgi:serine/threonine-protein kinase RsbW